MFVNPDGCEICYHSSDWKSVTGETEDWAKIRPKDKNIELIFLPVSVKYEGPGKIFEGSRDKNLLITLTHIWLPTHHKGTEGQQLFLIHF